MLDKAKTLRGYTLRSRDGDIGKVKEFYFDDQFWTIRYLVAGTGNWLTGRQVLLSPHALTAVNREAEYIAVNLTKKQIEESPKLGSDQPVSRQFEQDYFGNYGWPAYWGGLSMWGAYPYIVREGERDPKSWRETAEVEGEWDPHLRSTNAVTGYKIHAADGAVGHVEDFIIEDKTWAIRYLVVDTRDFWPGKKVLVSTDWIESIDWDQSAVFIDLPRETINESPEYTEKSLILRDYEVFLHQHYDRVGYWVNESKLTAHV